MWSATETERWRLLWWGGGSAMRDMQALRAVWANPRTTASAKWVGMWEDVD